MKSLFESFINGWAKRQLLKAAPAILAVIGVTSESEITAIVNVSIAALIFVVELIFSKLSSNRLKAAANKNGDTALNI